MLLNFQNFVIPEEVSFDSKQWLYYLNEDLSIDSLTVDKADDVVIYTGSFACTMCLEQLDIMLKSSKFKDVTIVYSCLGSNFSRHDFFTKSLSVRNELNSKLRGSTLSYTAYLSKVDSTIRKTPFVEVNCSDTIKFYSYLDVFEKGLEIKQCF